MYIKKQSKSGFTLVELLVVIAIMAILAATLFGSIAVVRERGQAAKIVGDMKIIKGALQFRFSEQTSYPTEEDLEAAYPALVGQTKSIANLITVGVFNGEFVQAPEPSFGTGAYIYDADASDGTTRYPIASCGSYTNNEFGVNIILTNVISTAPNVVSELDELIDNGDGLDCGTVRRATGGDNSILYNISVETQLFP